MTDSTEMLYISIPGYEHVLFTITDSCFDEEHQEFVYKIEMKNPEDEYLLTDTDFKDQLTNFIMNVILDSIKADKIIETTNDAQILIP